MRFEPWVVVGRRRPIGTTRSRIEVPTTPEAVARGHLAAHVVIWASWASWRRIAIPRAWEALNNCMLRRPLVPLEFLLEIPALRDPFLASQSSKVPTMGH